MIAVTLRRLAVAWLPAILWMGFIFYLSAQSRPLRTTPSFPAAVAAHFGEFALLAFLLLWGQLCCTPEQGKGRGRLLLALALSFLVAGLYGASDEYHQGFVPGRDASLADWGVDVAGAAAAVLLMALWAQGFPGRRARYRRTVLPAPPRREGP
jgi:VanZ family protein